MKMSAKFPALKRRFSNLYRDGTTYEEIAARLGINVQTALLWRKKLGLPGRSLSANASRAPQQWSDTPLPYRLWEPSKDEPSTGELSPKQILETISADLFLSPGDVKTILGRTANLINQGRHIGRPIVHLLLSQTFLYQRSKTAGRPSVGLHKFVTVCHLSGYDISVSQIGRITKHIPLISFPREPSATEKISRQKSVLKKELAISEESLNTAIKVAGMAPILEKVGRSPSPTSVAAASLYLASKSLGEIVTQRELADHFGVTEVTLRNVASLLDGVPDIRSILDCASNGEAAN